MKKIVLYLLLLNSCIFGSPGKIIIVDGLSSSGKTTIISNLISQLDETYEGVALDDFVTEIFIQRDAKHFSDDVFQLLISHQKQKMYETVIEKVMSGKNVLLDTVLLGFNGQEDLVESLVKFKDLQVIEILAYCPLGQLIDRMIIRNEIAKKGNNRANYRPLFLAFKFNEMFKKQEDGDIVVGKVFYNEVENVYTFAKNEIKDLEMLDGLRTKLIKNMDLQPEGCVNISSKISYDFFVDTSLDSPKGCANKIQEFLLHCQPKAFNENCEKFLPK